MARSAGTHLANAASRVVRRAVTFRKSESVTAIPKDATKEEGRDSEGFGWDPEGGAHVSRNMEVDRWHALIDQLPPSFKRGIRYSKAVFSAADIDGDGEITVDELKVLLAGMQCQLSSDQIELLAKAADQNGDGRLQFCEFVELFEARH